MATTGISFSTPINEIQIITPTLSLWIPFGMYIAFSLLLVKFIVKEIKARKETKAHELIVYLIIAYTLLLYNIFFIFEKNLILFLLISTVLHAIQYHFVAGNRIISVIGNEDSNCSNIMIWIKNIISQIVTNKVAWAIAIVSLSILIFLCNDISHGVIPLTWAMQHFYLDGIIWKKQKGKDLVSLLHSNG
ncbi:MAG: hypothetical protein ACFKPT_04650 [Gloeotrichia echinulata GP01]